MQHRITGLNPIGLGLILILDWDSIRSCRIFRFSLELQPRTLAFRTLYPDSISRIGPLDSWDFRIEFGFQLDS